MNPSSPIKCNNNTSSLSDVWVLMGFRYDYSKLLYHPAPKRINNYTIDTANVVVAASNTQKGQNASLAHPPTNMTMEAESQVTIHQMQLSQRRDTALPFFVWTLSIDYSIIFSTRCKRNHDHMCYHLHAHINCFKTCQLGCCKQLTNGGNYRRVFS